MYGFLARRSPGQNVAHDSLIVTLPEGLRPTTDVRFLTIGDYGSSTGQQLPISLVLHADGRLCVAYASMAAYNASGQRFERISLDGLWFKYRRSAFDVPLAVGCEDIVNLAGRQKPYKEAMLHIQDRHGYLQGCVFKKCSGRSSMDDDEDDDDTLAAGGKLAGNAGRIPGGMWEPGETIVMLPSGARQCPSDVWVHRQR